MKNSTIKKKLGYMRWFLNWAVRKRYASEKYFGIGLYVSAHSREGYWGTGAIDAICEQLQKELPGLRGFSAENVKKMRSFAEFWSQFVNRSPAATDLQVEDSQDIIVTDWILSLQIHFLFKIGRQ